MTILDEMENLIRKKECQKNNHEWEYDTSHDSMTVYFCKHCPAMLTQVEDCGHGG